MRSSNIIFLCLLATSLYLFTPSTSSSSPPTFLPGRRLLRVSSMSSSNQQHQYYQNIKVSEEMKRSTNLQGSMAIEYMSSNEDAEELLYHIDYHGVKTHPIPSPKHP